MPSVHPVSGSNAGKSDEAADEAYNAAWSWGHETNFGVDNGGFFERQDRFDDAEAELMTRIRADLAIPAD